ncbi:hypothetical protein GJAV_G00003360 [Gymnothorax javanicus]|nr:hypothetical protein GJAV_G00003360 [Gymnothorax javanicus]
MDEGFAHMIKDEMGELKEALEHQSLTAAVAKIQDYLEQLDHVELNIAVTGESGTGKSTFVNALRGLRNDSPGAAPTSPVETTMEPVMYPHPKHPTLKVWDLPGIGTPNFKADEYLEKVEFQLYDFFIIICSERLRESDVQLATEIQRMKKKFYFVRSKIDDSLRAEAKSKGFNKDKTLELIRKYCIKGLEACDVKSPTVFLISSFHLDRYDFLKLEKTIEDELPQHKRHVLLLALPNLTVEIHQKKKRILGKNILKLALISGCVAAVPIPALSFAVDVTILVKMLKKYYTAFGLDNESLQNLSKKTNVPLANLKAALKSSLNKEISEDLVIKLLATSVGAGLMVLEECVSMLPFIGSIVGGGISFTTTYIMLKSCLNELAEDAMNVLLTALQTEV